MKEEEESCCCQRCNRSRRSLLLRSPGERSDWIFDGTHTRLASLSPLHIPHSHILRDICPPIHFLVVYYKSAQGFPWKQSAKAKNLIKKLFFFFSSVAAGLTFFADGFTLDFDILAAGALGRGAELLLGRRLMLPVVVVMRMSLLLLPLLLAQLLLDDWEAALGGRALSVAPLSPIVVLLVVVVVVAAAAHFH